MSSSPDSKEEKMNRERKAVTASSPGHFRDILILHPSSPSTANNKPSRSAKSHITAAPINNISTDMMDQENDHDHDHDHAIHHEETTAPTIPAAASLPITTRPTNDIAAPAPPPPAPPADRIPAAGPITNSSAAAAANSNNNMVTRRKSASNQHPSSSSEPNNGTHLQRKRKSKRDRRKQAKGRLEANLDDAGIDLGEIGSTNRSRNNSMNGGSNDNGSLVSKCCNKRKVVRSTLSAMKLLAKILLWSSAVASTAAVIWYSNELKNNGTDKHLIAWTSAGLFVLLGFPISIYGIASHLANYNKPEEQCYIVRILWMVPIYSIGSWLCLRYKDHAIYIETLRDVYESYVLYNFFQFLIEILGGEEQLILMLKDKSPTRGAHMWGLQWCMKPWLMGQPVRKVFEATPPGTSGEAPTPIKSNASSGAPLKRVHWTSPFFLQCKFGVLQYVLLKILCTAAVMILEKHDVYKEGDFTPKGGYLYICILTNTSQCWALYCLILFYYATKTELSPIRPVGKFLAVKALVFFTWWQSLGIAILYQMDLIPHYHSGAADAGSDGIGSPYMPMSANDALALDEHGGDALDSSQLGQEWTPEDVAKGLQDYLICIEMFVAAMVHIFIFPLSEYDPQMIEARARALNQRPNDHWNKRLGRRWKEWDNKSGYSGNTVNSFDREGKNQMIYKSNSMEEGDDDLRIHPMDKMTLVEANERRPLLAQETAQSLDDDEYVSASCDDGYYSDSSPVDAEDPPPSSGIPSSPRRKTGFVSALLDSTIPQDLRDNTVGIIKGEYVVEKKTLLHHAATSDSYDLFSRVTRMKIKKKTSRQKT